MSRTLSGGFAVIAMLVSVSSEAQLIQPPPRSASVVAPNPTRASHELTFVGAILSGYDQDLAIRELDPATGLLISGTAYNAFGDAGLRYRLSRAAKSVTLTGRSYLNSYPATSVNPALGGDFGVEAETSTRRMRFSAGGHARYDPFFSLGAFAPLETEVGVVESQDSNPVHGLSTQHSWFYDGSAALHRDWNQRHTTEASYLFSGRQTQQLGAPDNRSHSVNVRYSGMVSRVASIGAAYTYGTGTFFGDESGTGRMSQQVMEGNAQYERLVSRTRRLGFSGGFGAEYASGFNNLSGMPYGYWAPSGQGAIRLDLGRNWALWADYRRSVAVLDRISSQSFPSDAAVVRTGGLIGSRLQAALSAGYVSGQSGVADESGHYVTYTASAQLSYPVASWCSAVVNYTYYRYSLDGITDLPAGVPPSFTRNAIRGGITISLPLITRRATTTAAPQRPGRS